MNTEEKEYLADQEHRDKNRDVEEKKKVNKAVEFRKAHGYSITFSKLMKKWNCATADAWRRVRRDHKKENYVGPRKEKKKVVVAKEANQNFR